MKAEANTVPATNLKWLTGILLIGVPIAFISIFTLLQMNFEYPDILAQPTDYILRKFSAGGAGLVTTWYMFMLTAIMFVPIALLLHPFLARTDTPYLPLATTFGVLAGVVQFLGLIRWSFVAPYLAQTYLDPAASQATRDAVVVGFQILHRYAGSGIGETLGYLFTSVWSLLIAFAMIRSSQFKPWVGWLGIPLSLAIFVGIFEGAGLPFAGMINAIGYTLWAVWLMIVGVFVLRARTEPMAS
jgi:hypothetical protein